MPYQGPCPPGWGRGGHTQHPLTCPCSFHPSSTASPPPPLQFQSLIWGYFPPFPAKGEAEAKLH